MGKVLNQLIYFGFLQAVFLICIFLFSNKMRKMINPYLGILIVALFVGLSGRVIYLSGLFGQSYRIVSLSEIATLCFGASVFLFTRSSLYRQDFSPKDLVHYLPALSYFGLLTFYYLLPSSEVINARIKSGEFGRAVLLFAGIGLSFNLYYYVRSILEFKRFQAFIKQEVSYSISTQFFSYFLLSVGLCFAPWLAVWILNLLGFDKLERIVRPYIWISLAFIIFFIAWYSIMAPEVFKIAPAEVVKKYAQSKLSRQDLDRLKDQLERLMEDQKPFLNKKLLKQELAEMLGISNPELARLLNERIGMNFFEYINYHRIMEFVELAKTERAKEFTFFGLAQEAGFNSKSTFNKSFKKLMGTSPSDYFKT